MIDITKTTVQIPVPVYRLLRGYSFDPSLSVQLDTALINEAVFKIVWEKGLQPGPVGEYLEVIDFDPASGCFYEPVDLNDKYILATDGLVPSESNPQFHQQMVYAVAMTTIQNFEKALGRRALWSSYRKVQSDNLTKSAEYYDEFYQHLRIYPHALRQANAYYSPAKKALLFGYFPASANAPGEHAPNAVVFTCLAHDIVAHETTHALLDGIHRRYIEPSQQDTLAFHEAFADIVALFQHFSFPEVLRHQIAKTRGDLASQSLLGQLAQQFGRAIGQYGALRDAIGEFDVKENKWEPKQPDPNDYQTIVEPHARGAILVAAVFEAFISIYKSRVADLLRIASNGTGVLLPGELPPDLVNRLADTAAKSAQQVLNMCIRALDYCPPVDINFGDYLRAIITADSDLIPDDDLGYRVAFIESFRRRGIYPRDLRTLSEDSLSWNRIRDDQQQFIFRHLASRVRFFVHQLTYLNEFPRIENLQDLNDHVIELTNENIDYLKGKLIPRIDQRWSEIPKEAKENARKEILGEGSVPPDRWQSVKKQNICDHKYTDRELAEMIIWETMSDRERIFALSHTAQGALHFWLATFKQDSNSDDVKKFEELTGLRFWQSPEKDESALGLHYKNGKYAFEVHAFRAARRVGPDGERVDEVLITITQKRDVGIVADLPASYYATPEDERDESQTFEFRGGCTLILDLQTLKLKYVVKKLITDNERVKRQREYRNGEEQASLYATYFGRPGQSGDGEPFALLHQEF
ncbi:MAG: hypothetical protein ABI999_09390 [Acidobacteriota bacterium]